MKEQCKRRKIFMGVVMVIIITGAFVIPGSYAGDFDKYIMPVSNPIYHGDARNITMIRPIFLYQNLPDKVDTTVGEVPLDGNVQGIAVQASYAFNERFSFVAVKDGYVNCKPDNVLSDHDGLLDLAAGFQYSFYYEPVQSAILTGRVVVELPTGDDDVYQENGSGNIAPSILFLKGIDKLQLSGTLGFVIPFDKDEENTLFYDSWHIDYAVTDWLMPLVEFNHFYVIDSGDRDVPAAGLGAIGTDEEDDLVAGIAKFNGCDVINLGGKHNDDHPNLVTMAVGARIRPLDWLNFGLAYEFSLTDEENSLLDSRFLVDAVITFNF